MFKIVENNEEKTILKEAFWHTTSHVMAQAVKNLFDVKLAIGPAIKEGFYYDFDKETPFTEEDIKRVEEEMKKIISKEYDVVCEKIKKQELIKIYEEKNEIYKLEMLNELEDEEITIYRQGDFFDMCKGPHIDNIKYIKAFKLLSTSGAYWKGNEANKMLQRIYGISFPTEEMLEEYIKKQEEARKRDHRKLGKELKLFTLLPEGPGFPFYLPKGMLLRNNLINFWKKLHRKNGYEEISTPIVLNEELWHQSGHWDHYKENMYFTKIDDKDYALKPMNCPGGILIYKTELRSYRDLPIRMGEMGLVHRHEKSGELNGLLRVRAFTQDDAHIFCTKDQVESEITKLLALVNEIYSAFNFEFRVELSTRPEDSMGSVEDWEKAENALKKALEQNNIKYEINEGDGAFYGPKIDFHLYDCIGRSWQCGTIQLDFQMPERFNLEYIAEDGKKYRPVMIHRAILGSLERFTAQVIEQFAGAFPTWLAPIKVKVLSIGNNTEYAENIKNILEESDIPSEVDIRDEKIGYKIREAKLEKIPYLIIVGDKEKEENMIAVNSRDKGDLGKMNLNEFIEKIQNEISNRSNG